MSKGLLFSIDALAATLVVVLSFSMIALATSAPPLIDSVQHQVALDQSIMALYNHEPAIPLSPTPGKERYCLTAFFWNGSALEKINNQNPSSADPNTGVVCS